MSARRPVRTVAAVDLGAESGRVVQVDFDGEHLGSREISRFTHSPVPVGGILRWDLDHLTRAITEGPSTSGGDGTSVTSVGVDAWGVDYGLLDADGVLVDRPRSFVSPNSRGFLQAGDMPARVQAYCRRSGQLVRESRAAIARCMVDSLASSYRTTAEDIAAVCVTGGGARNGPLAQVTADATGLPVPCGPVEATSLANATTQLVALGELGGSADIRALIARTTELRIWSPRSDSRWEQAAAQLRDMTQDDDRHRGLIPT